MDGSEAGRWLRDLEGSLASSLGSKVMLARAGPGARWSFGDQALYVREGRGATVEALFADHPVYDAVTQRRTMALYRPQACYALDRSGCARMADDAIAFFQGVREPRFAFAALHEIDMAT